MTEQNHLRTSSDGISTQGSRQNLNAISAIVMGLALIWVIFCGFVFWSIPPVSTEAALDFSGAALLPAAVLGVCALMIQKFQSSHQDAHRLHTAVEALRHSFIDKMDAVEMPLGIAMYLTGHGQYEAALRVHKQYGTGTPPEMHLKYVLKANSIENWGNFDCFVAQCFTIVAE